MINITTNIPRKPTITSVPLSSLKVGTVFQFTPNQCVQTFDNIVTFEKLTSVWIKGIVIDAAVQPTDKVKVLRFMDKLGDNTVCEFKGNSHVIPLEVKSMELVANFQ